MEFKNCINCNSCKDIIFDKIYQCKSGHIYCEDCVKPLKKCKVCQVAIDKQIRARATEHVRDLFDLTCPNAGCVMRLTKGHKSICKFNKCPNDCGFMGIESELITHKQLCRRRKMRCIYSSDCKQELMITEILEHIQLQHHMKLTTPLLDEIIILDIADHLLLLPNGDVVVVKLKQTETVLLVNVKSFITQFYKSSIKIYDGKNSIDKIIHNLTVNFSISNVVWSHNPKDLICAMRITKLKI